MCSQKKCFIFPCDITYNIATHSNSPVCEYDKLSQNTNVINTNNLRQSMQNASSKELDIKQHDMKVTLKFPENPQDEDEIKEEVKTLLFNMLGEHLRKLP